MVAMDFFAALNCYDFLNQYCSNLLKNPTVRGLTSFIGAVVLISSSHSCVTLTAYLYSLPFRLGSCLDGTSGPS